ncbi:hypothetical protein H4R24_002090 [Coemansia sp. RSA 988]|nr:hypothetical protein H4R24_002090 [Coemansia sp. RSA 988]
MHSAVYQPSQPMQHHAPMLYPVRRIYVAPPSLEDSDNIDDILRNLWPTSGPTGSCQSLLYPTAPSMQDGCHGYLRSWAPTLPPITSGQSTPPEEAYIAAGSREQKPFPYASFVQPSQTSGDATPSYTLVASGTSSTASTFDTTHKQQAAPLRRSVSASIQIGDPEWRVDSPQSVRASTAPHAPVDCLESVKLPSPISPISLGPSDPSALSPDGLLVNCNNKSQGSLRQPTTLGLGAGTGSRALPSLRRATLGLLRNDKTGHKSAALSSTDSRYMARVLTPEERVARLHSVSGLAAHAVARRCLSGQIPVPTADAMLRQTSSHLSANPSPFTAGRKKPTFADVARGSQDL